VGVRRDDELDAIRGVVHTILDAHSDWRKLAATHRHTGPVGCNAYGSSARANDEIGLPTLAPGTRKRDDALSWDGNRQLAFVCLGVGGVDAALQLGVDMAVLRVRDAQVRSGVPLKGLSTGTSNGDMLDD
jgi:hypothetical protein